jgi:hypothetical protein
MKKILSFLLLTFFFPSLIFAAITYDTAVSGGTTTNSTSYTLSCTVGSNDNRLLVVGVMSLRGAADNVSGVTYNGVAMTKIATKASDADRRLYLYYLLAPDTGTHDIVVSYSAEFYSTAVGAISLYNVAQQAHEVTNNAAGYSTNATTSMTTVTANDWIVDVVGCDNGARDLAPQGGETGRWMNNTDGRVEGGTLSAGAAGSKTLSWTIAASQSWGIIGAAFVPYTAPTTYSGWVGVITE